jgi:hypothetical protein
MTGPRDSPPSEVNSPLKWSGSPLPPRHRDRRQELAGEDAGRDEDGRLDLASAAPAHAHGQVARWACSVPGLRQAAATEGTLGVGSGGACRPGR